MGLQGCHRSIDKWIEGVGSLKRGFDATENSQCPGDARFVQVAKIGAKDGPEALSLLRSHQLQAKTQPMIQLHVQFEPELDFLQSAQPARPSGEDSGWISIDVAAQEWSGISQFPDFGGENGICAHHDLA